MSAVIYDPVCRDIDASYRYWNRPFERGEAYTVVPVHHWLNRPLLAMYDRGGTFRGELSVRIDGYVWRKLMKKPRFCAGSKIVIHKRRYTAGGVYVGVGIIHWRITERKRALHEFKSSYDRGTESLPCPLIFKETGLELDAPPSTPVGDKKWPRTRIIVSKAFSSRPTSPTTASSSVSGDSITAEDAESISAGYDPAEISSSEPSSSRGPSSAAPTLESRPSAELLTEAHDSMLSSGREADSGDEGRQPGMMSRLIRWMANFFQIFQYLTV
ncbi:hypothetical protein GGR50DRAFT_698998 [Xylaria sp. CBS 124048]|nr:hypothetical protein GGR50DRAFT_698998 [Xylaria sp. CBS 124048]